MKQALVVDDHPIVREGIRDLLQRTFPNIEIQESCGGEGLLAEVCRLSRAFIVLDLHLRGQNSLNIIKAASKCCRQIPIIVFSFFSEQQYARRALRAGAVAYVSKEVPPSVSLRL